MYIRKLLLTPILLSLALYAQTGTSSFGGVVSDPSGAAIREARINIESPATGAADSTRSDAEGRFRFPSLLPGEYLVTIDADGFAQRIIRGLTLSASENHEIVVGLDLPTSVFRVETVAAAEGVRIQTADAQIQRVITLKELDTLPQISRNPLQLATFSPGVQMDGEFSRVNGTRNSSSNVKQDGILTVDPVYPRLGHTLSRINLDAISEVRVILNGAKAEFGRNGGAQIELVSRRGSNQWSGNLFAYHRNTVLNANSFFNNLAGVPRPKLILNQFGGSLGGPIIHNRTFFHLNVQSSITAQEVVRNRTVLTPEAKAGLFRWRSPGSSAIQSFDIPRNDPRSKGIDPLVQSKLAILPAPNNTLIGDGLNTAGFRFNNPANVFTPQGTARIDHQLRKNHRLFFRLSRHYFESLDSFNGLDAPYPGQPAGHQISNSANFSVGSDWSISPTLINEIRVGRTASSVTFQAPRSGPVVVPALYTNTELSNTTSERSAPVFELNDSLTWIRGRHTWKTGGTFQRNMVYFNDDAGKYPTFTLNRNNGNLPAASIGPSGAIIAAVDRQRFESLYNDLLGRVSAISQTFYSNLETYLPAGSSRVRNQRFQDWGFFLQDDWRIHPRLMLNIGLRYELFQVPIERSGFMGTLDRRNALLGATPLTDLNIQRAEHYLPSDKNNFTPRFGFAWDPFGTGKTSVRGSFAIFNDRGIAGFMRSIDGNTPGFAFTGQSFPNLGGASDVRLSDNPTLPTAPARVQTLLPVTRSTSMIVVPDGLRNPYFMHWNFSIQREFLHGTVLEAAYVATRGVKLIHHIDRNQKDLVSSGFLQDFVQLQAFQRAGTPVPASNNLVRIFGTPAAAINSLGGTNFQLGAAGTAAENLDRGFFTRYAAAGLPQTYLRPFPQFASVWTSNNDGRSYFDSLQLSLRRDTGWLRLSANYTFSKNIEMTVGDGGSGDDVIFDRFNSRLARGLAVYHMPHLFNAMATARIPFGWGRQFGRSIPRWLDLLAGGWDLGTLALAQTGYAFGVGGSVDTYGAGGSRANYSGPRIGQLEVRGDGPRFFTPEQMSLFSIPAAGQLGTGSSNMFRNPAFWNIDTSLVKRIPVREGQSVILRLETYNTFNHVNFGGVNTNLLNPQTFGKLTGTNTAPRNVQIALRYEF